MFRSKKKVGFSEDTTGGEEREGRSRSRSRLRLRRSKSQDIRSVTPKENIPKKRDHSLVSLVRTGSRSSVKHLVKLFETKPGSMNEGRKSQIILPDERRLEILIQPKLNSKDLLDLVSSHFKLKEKEYFGIYFVDDTGHHNWLNPDKKVLEHDFSKKTGLLILYFAVRFYVESISCLRDNTTVEIFYLNAKHAVFTGLIECDSETSFELAAYVLQAIHGDYEDDGTTKEDLKKLPVIPTSALKEHPSIVYCEDKVISYYKKLVSASRGFSIVNYMTIVENLPTYGIHYYEVKDKKDIPWWLGVSHKGIAVYDKTDKTTPRKIFTWKQLENLYYRDKKFSIEVHDPKRVVHTLSSFNLYEDAIREPINECDELSDAISDPTTQVSVSRRTFGPGNVAVHAWFGATPQLTKCIWSMAVAQHQFYLDRKHSKVNLPAARSVSEIAAELSRSSTSLAGSTGSDISRSGSSASLPSLTTSRYDLNLEQLDCQKVQREMYQALKARRDALEDTLRKKTEELKLLCIKEGELTGKLPSETPLAPGEEPPQIRRRVGTAFTLSSKIIDTEDQNDSDLLSKLELEFELQKQITSAAQKLSQDKSISKNVRKQRRQSFHRAQLKLKEMEKKLQDTQQFSARSAIKPAAPSYDATTSPTKSPDINQYRSIDYNDLGRGDADFPPMMQRSATARELSPTQTSPPQLSPTLSSPALCGEYRQQNKQVYSPVLTNRSHSSGSNMSNQSEYENVHPYNRYNPGSQDSGFSSANNMYNITTQRTSHYESTDELKTPTNKDSSESVFDNNKLGLTSKHGSLDGSYRKSYNTQHSYGSLERNRRGDKQPRDRQLSDSEANVKLANLEPTKYGSKRSSQSDYDLSTPRNSVVEVPVAHEEHHNVSSTPSWEGGHKGQRAKGWQDVVKADPSPIIKSPEQPQNTDSMEQCYSPRACEGSFQFKGDSSHHDQSRKMTESPKPAPKGHSSALVTVTKLQPHQSVEVISKPFEMSDFYKYSEKIRRQRMIEQYQQQLMGGNSSRCSTPSQHSSDSGDSSSVRHYQGSGGQGSPSSSPFRAGTVSRVSSQRQTSPFLQQKRTEQYPSHNSPKFVKEQSTHVQYTMQTAGSRVYKSVQTTTHTQYKPLTPMKCDPIRNQATPVTQSGSSTPNNRTPSASARRTHYRDHRESPHKITVNSPASCDTSFSALEPRDTVAEDFSEEMLAWYDDSDVKKKPSTFV